MKTCNRIQTASRYMDGELSPRKARGFELHLQICPECREALEGMQAVGRLAGRMPHADPPPGLEVSLIRNIRRRGEAMRLQQEWEDSVRLSKRLAPAAAIACALLIAFSLAFFKSAIPTYRAEAPEIERQIVAYQPEPYLSGDMADHEKTFLDGNNKRAIRTFYAMLAPE